jgi:hypothetical protein
MAWVVAVPATVAGQAAQTGPEVTYTKHVAPILQRSCENCHRAGGVGPMPLSTYAQVRPWARAIRLKTAAREMPPWFIEKNIGIQEFKDDPSLSDAEIARISAWVNAGAPEGNPADMPPPRQFPVVGAWNYGTPDLIVSSPVVTIKAEASDWYGDIGFTPTGLTEDRYIKAVEVREFRPQDEKFGRVQGRTQGDLNLFTVHHISVSTLAPGVRSNEESSGTPAEEGAPRLPKGDFSYLFEVGQNAMIYPDDVGILLPAGSNIYYNVAHLHSIGRELPVQVQVGFTFHPKGYKPKYDRGLSGVDLRLTELDIPSNADNVRYDVFTTLQHSMKMVTYEPHLHAAGKRMCVEALYADGFREVLNCAGYNHNWVKAYVYEDDAAPLLPKGTILHVTGWYDNSSKNPRVVDPRNWRGLGDRSIDDMFFLLSRFVYYTEDEFKAEVAAREQRKKNKAEAGARSTN